MGIDFVGYTQQFRSQIRKFLAGRLKVLIRLKQGFVNRSLAQLDAAIELHDVVFQSIASVLE
jgi:hypothetical protein